jgi:hypothetical protein
MSPQIKREGETPLAPFEYERDVDPAKINEIRDHVRSALKRRWHTIVQAKPRPDAVAIVGGGPSLKDHLEELRAFNGAIICVNHTLDYLMKNGIEPWGVVFGEIGSWKPSFLNNEYEDVWYLAASQCHPDTLDMVEGRKVLLWHCIQECGEDKIIRAHDPKAVMIGGGNSVYTRAINIAHVMGFRDFHLWGCDSSFDEQTHVYHDRPVEPVIEIEAAGKRFKTTTRLAMQADHLRFFTRTFGGLCGFKCHADGLFPHIHRTMFPTIYQPQKDAA